MSLRVLAAAQRVGMPLTLLPVLYCRSGFASPDCATEQRRFCHDLDDYLVLMEACQSGLSGDSTQAIGMAPHSLRAVPDYALKALLESGLTPMPVHIHIAEQTGEVEQCVEHTGARPVEWLLEQMPVDGSWCLVHATHLSTEERQRAARTGATVGLCPSTEADLGDGMFAMEPFRSNRHVFDLWLFDGEVYQPFEAFFRAVKEPDTGAIDGFGLDDTALMVVADAFGKIGRAHV